MRVSRQFLERSFVFASLRGTVSARTGFDIVTVDLFTGSSPPSTRERPIYCTNWSKADLTIFRNNTGAVHPRFATGRESGCQRGRHRAIAFARRRMLPASSLKLALPAPGRSDRFDLAFTRTRVAQMLLQRPFKAHRASYYKLRSGPCPALAAHFEQLFQHDAASWQEREESTLQLFLTLRVSAAVTVSLIILLAGFGIFNVLTMSVLAKVKEIAILRSMGYRRIDISAIFLWQGALIAAAGSLFGCLLGALVTVGISHIPIRIRGLLYADHFLVAWDWRHYFWGTLLALLAVFIASYVPARRAAELPPVATLRGSSV